MKVYYQNGPEILIKGEAQEVARYENGTVAIAAACFDTGKVAIFSPHPEGSITQGIRPTSATLELLKNSIEFCKKERAAILKRYKVKNKTLLDIGAEPLSIITAKNFGCQVTTIDISADELKAAKREGIRERINHKIRFEKADAACGSCGRIRRVWTPWPCPPI